MVIARYWLPRHLVGFRQAFPRINIRLAIGTTAQVTEAIEVGAAARSTCARIVLASSKNARSASVSSTRRPDTIEQLGVMAGFRGGDGVAGCGLRQVRHSSGLGHVLALGDCNENPEFVEPHGLAYSIYF